MAQTVEKSGFCKVIGASQDKQGFLCIWQSILLTLIVTFVALYMGKAW